MKREAVRNLLADQSFQDKTAQALYAGHDPLGEESAVHRLRRQVEDADWLLVVIDGEESLVRVRVARIRGRFQSQPHTLSLPVPRHRPGDIAHGQLLLLNP